MTATHFSPAVQLASSVRDGQETSEALTTAYVERIRNHNPALNAIVQASEQDALREARERDADLATNLEPGRLHGVPVTVKEAFDMKGLTTTVNFPQLKDNVATSDSLVVQRLRAAGAVILGKTNVPTMLADYQSFGPLYPTATNPYDTGRTPGGSTGGGAAALAAGLTALEIGSDIGGSIRVPAHFCGLFGLKPTENSLVHGEGHVPPVPGARGGYVSMASVGPLARTMADIDLAWSIIGAPSWNYLSHLPQKPAAAKRLNEYRIGWFSDPPGFACGTETRTVLEAFLRRLEYAGVTCLERSLDRDWWNEAYQLWGLLFGSIMSQDIPWVGRLITKWQFSRMGRGASIPVLRSLMRGLDRDFMAFTGGLRRRMKLIDSFRQQFDDVDFVVCPVAAGPAFPHNHTHGPIELEGREIPYMDYVAPFTVPFNACGNPVLVVPAGRTATGLPIGLQIAAPHYAERDLIHFGELVEEIGVASFSPPDGY